LDLALDHVFNSVAAAAADADHFDLGALVEFFGLDHFNGHGASPKLGCSCLGFLNAIFLFERGCQHRHGRDTGGLALAK
jgi:hypothetical protein